MILPGLFLCTLVSCGNNDGPRYNPLYAIPAEESSLPDGSNIEGTYAADLIPLNVNLHLKTVGKVGIERVGDNFTVQVKLKYGSPNVEHKQAIYLGNRCPNLYDDLNKDAYIDLMESQIAMGGMLIPLDGDLESQKGGYGNWPVSAESGGYLYRQTGSFERLFTDLKQEDSDLTDSMVKLGADDGVSLAGRVLIIQGTADSTFLPITVAEVEGMSRSKAIPVACAILQKAEAMPEELDDLTHSDRLSTGTTESSARSTTTGNPPATPTRQPRWYERVWDSLGGNGVINH